jgi:BsuBI/PstI restriction endonuclease domain/BsuBI/PstI restriction endonuclease HTH domain
MKIARNIARSLKILASLGLPPEQRNERSALCLLALLNLGRGDSIDQAEAPLIGITPMMEFALEQYGKKYAPNTRETFRRQTMHQFMEAGLALYNPDDPSRPVNSPKAVYQIEPTALELIRKFGSDAWERSLADYLSTRNTLVAKYAQVRMMAQVPIQVAPGREIKLSPGLHSELIKAIVEEFGSRFAPNGILIYIGDTGDKWGYYDEKTLASLGVNVDSHGKMPDVLVYDKGRNWLLLVESVTSHGPVNGKRHAELVKLFSSSTAGLVFVTAFPSRSLMTRYLAEIAWETEVWVADAPTHLIHFNGERYLGPH